MDILLVEDQRMDIELMLYALKKSRSPCNIVVMQNGQDALNYLLDDNSENQHAGHSWPNLILLDLKMPGIDGHQVLAKIKQTKHLKQIPVVILTSSSELKDRIRCYDSGANSYMVKPSSYHEFKMLIDKIREYWLELNTAAEDS